MKQPRAVHLIFLVAISVSLPVLAARLRNNLEQDPLGKTLELLRNLAAKVQKEGEAADQVYEDYFEWCGKSTFNAKNEVTVSSKQLEKLKARIADLSSAIETADSSIEELASMISKCEAEQKEAEDIREDERAEFEQSESSLLAAISAFDRASSILERNLQKNGASLAQFGNNNTRAMLESLSAVVDAAGLPAKTGHQLLVLSQTGVGDMRMSDAAAQVYETKSSGIMDVLEDMKDKAAAQLSSLRKTEKSLKHDYKLLKQSLDHKLEADTKDMDEQKLAKAAAEEEKAATEGDLSMTEKEGKQAATDLEEVQKTCMQAAADHEESSKERSAELKALRQAAKILAQQSEEALTQELPTSLVQLKVSSKERMRAKAAAAASLVAVVRRLAQQHHSATLARLASRISAVVRYGRRAGGDPFAKVKQLIQDLLEKLIKEGEAEAQEKEYCDQEMRTANGKRKELEDGISTAKASIEQATARLADLQQDIRDLETELAAIADEQAEMDKNRRAAHEEFLRVKSNFESGLSAVRGALEVLRDYYASKSEDAAMLQDDSDSDFHSVMQRPAFTRHPAFPQRFAAAKGAGTTIINILEVIESDSSTNLEKAEAEEADAQAAHDEMTRENELSNQKKSLDVKYKTRESQSLAKRITEVSSDRASSETELVAVMEYISKLESRCIAQPDAFEERMKRKVAEINGLKEALHALEG